MSVGDKLTDINGLQVFIRATRASISDRKNVYFCFGGQRVIKTDRSFIDLDKINFWMRNPARFDDVFYGRLFRELAVDHCTGAH